MNMSVVVVVVVVIFSIRILNPLSKMRQKLERVSATWFFTGC